MSVTVGVLAHVDAGKTTFSEQLLYAAGAIRRQGRVDHGDTVMDASNVERERGITVWADQAAFTCGPTRVTLIDTPGHSDFAAEMERALSALDLAFLLLDGSSALPAYTVTLFSMARARGIPVMILINKTDLISYDRNSCLAAIRSRLTPAAVPVVSGLPDAETLAMLDDAFCEHLLEGTLAEGEDLRTLASLFARGEAFPVLELSALSGTGIPEVLSLFSFLAPFCEHGDPSLPLQARVCRVRRDDRGERVVFLKLLRGTVTPRQSFTFGEQTEKIHQIFVYSGASRLSVPSAGPGETVGVTGLSVPRCGDLITESGIEGHDTAHLTPVLQARLTSPDGVPAATLLEKAKILEDEDPTLSVTWNEALGALHLRIMGTIQTEVLTRVMADRFSLRVVFEPPEVLYMETIASPVVGCGHYEPLRHYAETHLLLEPAPRGSGITFDSRCSVDDLPLNFQRLIRTHVFEKTHKGVLTGSPLTDVHVILLAGRHHLKHTEGGDFRETVYRAIRQALMKGSSLLLEPFYRFTVTVPADCLGRVITDLSSLSAQCDPPVYDAEHAEVSGRAPVATLMDYTVTLRSFTHGQGDIRLLPDGYDLCHNPDEVISRLSYDPDADTANPSSSVFCSHGAGYTVLWHKADSFMHLPVEE